MGGKWGGLPQGRLRGRRSPQARGADPPRRTSGSAWRTPLPLKSTARWPPASPQWSGSRPSCLGPLPLYIRRMAQASRDRYALTNRGRAALASLHAKSE
jgi:hypothetical protein